MTDQTTLVMIDRDSSVDRIIDQVLQAGTQYVDVLILNGAPALESRKACDRLREKANRQSVDFTFYTDNEAIIRAAEKCQINVVPVDPAALHGATPATTAATPAAASTAAAAAPSPEEAFLQSLAEVPFEAAPQPTPSDQVNAADWLREDEDPWASSFDAGAAAPAAATPAARPTEADDDPWFDAFNDLSDVISGDPATAAAAPAERPRVRPEDIELTSDDLDRQNTRARRAAKAAEADSAAASGRKPNLRTLLLVLLAAAIIGAVVWFVFFRQPGVTVQVSPPLVGENTIDNVRLIIASEPLTDPTSDAIQGRIIAAPVSVTTQGTISSTTNVPDAQASGLVTVINPNTQSYQLPAGTSLATTGPNGEELLFLTTQEVTVPAAETSFSGTTNGFAAVPVQAVTGGELYNVPTWTEDRPVWAIRGYEGVLFGVNDAPVTGGTVRQERIPTQEDIQLLLGQALPQLQNAAYTQLRTQLQPDEELAGTVPLQPALATLAENPALYSIETRPIQGNENMYELVITTEFRGLAVPTNQPLPQQLERALPLALQLHEINPETTRVISSNLILTDEANTNLLLADVVVGPRESDELVPQAQRTNIAQRLAGKPYNEAQAILADMVSNGEISRFVLPEDLQQFPEDPAAISIQVIQ